MLYYGKSRNVFVSNFVMIFLGSEKALDRQLQYRLLDSLEWILFYLHEGRGNKTFALLSPGYLSWGDFRPLWSKLCDGWLHGEHHAMGRKWRRQRVRSVCCSLTEFLQDPNQTIDPSNVQYISFPWSIFSTRALGEDHYTSWILYKLCSWSNGDFGMPLACREEMQMSKAIEI